MMFRFCGTTDTLGAANFPRGCYTAALSVGRAPLAAAVAQGERLAVVLRPDGRIELL